MSTTISSSGSPDSIKNELVSELSPKAAAPAAAAAAKTGKTKNRKRVNSAEKRSQHNAIERQRRETLNGKFISLARLLPVLAATRRPSKSAIVNGSIAHLNYQRSQRLLAAKLLRQVCMQHDQLLEEVNHWRSRAGVAPKDASVWTSEMDDICAVEKEVFGVFSNEDGDGPDDDDADDVVETSFDASMAASLSSLIDHRGSNDMEMANNFLMAQAQAAAAAAAVAIPANPTVSHNANPATLNWSRDMTFGSMSSSTSSLPFNAFMADSLDHSSTGSPANSIQGNVLTPPEMGMYTHTPSPRSSLNDGGDAGRVNAGTHGWTEQQMLFLQSMQPPAAARQQSMPALGMPGHPFNNQPTAHNNLGTNNSATTMLNNLFAQSQMHNAQNVLSAAMSSGSDAFTRSLLAQMFPSQGHVPEDSVAQWRKLAMAGLNQNAMDSIPQSARTVRPSVLRSNSMWEQPVEGF